MRTQRIFIWLLIATFASVVGLLTSPIGQSHNSMQRQPAKFKVLRRKDQLAFKPTAKEIQEQELPQLERIFDNQIPKHVPLKIKIKKEKDFKDLSNDKWERDFVLEVTNTGDKPIYYLYLLLRTDIKNDSGGNMVFPLAFGRTELSKVGNIAEPDDIAIEPGETYSLIIHPGNLEGWEIAKRKERYPQTRKLQLMFQIINFGDGTGFVGSSALPLPRKLVSKGERCYEPPYLLGSSGGKGG